MTDRIDPGPGWRLLKEGERKPEGYQSISVDGFWRKGSCVGEVFRQAESIPCRVRVYREGITKAIATRATVRVVSSNGTAERSIRCDSGLSVGQMYAAIASFDGAVDALRNRTSVPKYIMFEIQRDPNDC